MSEGARPASISRLTSGRQVLSDVQKIVERLEEDVIVGRLLPRERLIEDALMERFSAKRHVVRQALVVLEGMRVVTRGRNRGVVVRDFSVRDVEEIYELREVLQERAARRIPLPPDRALIVRLKHIHARHAAAVEGGDLRAVYRINNDFHNTLFDACGNRHLVEAIAHYAWLAHAIRSYRIADPVLLVQARDEHGAMIDALEGGKRERFVRLCVDHIKPSKEAYLVARRAVEALDPDAPASSLASADGSG